MDVFLDVKTNVKLMMSCFRSLIVNSRIQYLVMDVDGTLSDGKIYMGKEGEILKAFNVKDGIGIKMAMQKGIHPIILTSRFSQIVDCRAKELGIDEVYQSIDDKCLKLSSIIRDLGFVAYIGDDITDLTAMKAVRKAGGIVGCPSDAASSVISISDFVSTYKGGEGAVREFVEWLFIKM